MSNILYLDDYINFYDEKNHQLIIAKPYKNTLRNGFIIDREKFNKKFLQMLDSYDLKQKFFSESLIIVINNLFTKEDKILIKEIMENLNYKNIKFVQEIKYLKVDKTTLYINCNVTYYYLIYTNYLGNVEINLYKNDELNKNYLVNIIKYLNKDKIILYGKNFKEIVNLINKQNIDYYYYKESDNLMIHYLLNNKKV